MHRLSLEKQSDYRRSGNHFHSVQALRNHSLNRDYRLYSVAMAERIFNATASDLMTSDVESRPRTMEAGKVQEWLRQNDFTAAPIYDTETEEPIGYVEEERIEDSSEKIHRYVEYFDLSNIISTGANFQEILQALCRRYFYFLGGADELTGILTRADLNKPASYIHLYERITHFEEVLRDRLIEWKKIGKNS